MAMNGSAMRERIYAMKQTPTNNNNNKNDREIVEENEIKKGRREYEEKRSLRHKFSLFN